MLKGLAIVLLIVFATGANAFQIPSDDYRESRISRSVSAVGENNYRCTSQQTYDDVYPGDCQKYYHCSEGQPEEKKCWFFHRFDPEKLICRWRFFVTCVKETITTESPVPTNPTSYTQIPTRSTGRTSGPTSGPQTAGTGTGGHTATPSPTQASSGASQICGMVSVVLMLTSAVLLIFRY